MPFSASDSVGRLRVEERRRPAAPGEVGNVSCLRSPLVSATAHAVNDKGNYSQLVGLTIDGRHARFPRTTRRLGSFNLGARRHADA